MIAPKTSLPTPLELFSPVAHMSCLAGNRTAHSTSAEPPHQSGNEGGAMQALVATKQRELAEVMQYQVTVLQGEVEKRDEALAKAAERQQALKADFGFNLELIAERDAELEAFETSFEELRQCLRDKDAEVSEAKVALAGLEEDYRKSEAAHADARVLLSAKLRDCKAEAERVRWSSEQALRAERERTEELRRRAGSSEAEHASALESERAEVTALYETKLRSWEDESRRRCDSLSTALKAAEARALEASRALERRGSDLAHASEAQRNAEALATKAQAALASAAEEAEARRGEGERRREEGEAQWQGRVAVLEEKAGGLEVRLATERAAVVESQRFASQQRLEQDSKHASEVARVKAQQGDAAHACVVEAQTRFDAELLSSADANRSLVARLEVEVEGLKKRLRGAQEEAAEAAVANASEAKAEEATREAERCLRDEHARSAQEATALLRSELSTRDAALKELSETFDAKVAAAVEERLAQRERGGKPAFLEVAATTAAAAAAAVGVCGREMVPEEGVGAAEDGSGMLMLPPAPSPPGALMLASSSSLDGFLGDGGSEEGAEAPSKRGDVRSALELSSAPFYSVSPPPPLQVDLSFDDHGGGNDDGSSVAAALRKENVRLRTAVADMRGHLHTLTEELTQQQQQQQQQHGDFEEVGLLKARVKHSEAHAALLLKQLEASSKVTTTVHGEEEGEAEAAAAEAAAAAAAAEVAEARQLAVELEEEVAAVSAERDRLMALSNKLRGDLARAMSVSVADFPPGALAAAAAASAAANPASVSSPPTPSAAAQIQSQEGEGAEGEGGGGGADGDLQSSSSSSRRLVGLERAVRELASQNQTLRKELKKVKVDKVELAKKLNDTRKNVDGKQQHSPTGQGTVALADTQANTAHAAPSNTQRRRDGTGCSSGSSSSSSSSGNGGDGKVEEGLVAAKLRVPFLRLDLLRPAVRGLFQDAHLHASAAQSQQKCVRLGRSALVCALMRDDTAALLLLGQPPAPAAGDAAAAAASGTSEAAATPPEGRLREKGRSSRVAELFEDGPRCRRARAVLTALGVGDDTRTRLNGKELGAAAAGVAVGGEGDARGGLVDEAELAALWSAWAELSSASATSGAVTADDDDDEDDEESGGEKAHPPRPGCTMRGGGGGLARALAVYQQTLDAENLFDRQRDEQREGGSERGESVNRTGPLLGMPPLAPPPPPPNDGMVGTSSVARFKPAALAAVAFASGEGRGATASSRATESQRRALERQQHAHTKQLEQQQRQQQQQQQQPRIAVRNYNELRQQQGGPEGEIADAGNRNPSTAGDNIR